MVESNIHIVYNILTYDIQGSESSNTSNTSSTSSAVGIFIGVLVAIVALGMALKFRLKRRNDLNKSARLTDLEQVDFEE